MGRAEVNGDNAKRTALEMTEALLEITHISKSFPGVRALDDVTFQLHHGEVLTLAGENGAGKSTLLSVLGGSLTPDSGQIRVGGVVRESYSPLVGLSEGIVIARQEPAVVPQLTVEQNLLLGRSAKERDVASSAVDEAMENARAMGFLFAKDDKVGALSPAQRQALTIAKAFAFGAKIIALDEPTTSMLDQNAQEVIRQVRALARDRKVGVLFVSHKMNEVMKVSDRVLVLRDGTVGYESKIGDTSEKEIVRAMVGRELLAFQRRRVSNQDTSPVFEAKNITHPSGTSVPEIHVGAGEVVGIAGLVGSGRTELLRAIVHADKGSTATIKVNGQQRRINTPEGARRAGIAFIPEDRKAQGLVLVMPAYSNIALTAAPDMVPSSGIISPKKQSATASAIGEKLDLRPRDVRLSARQYSGGNQQKIVIAKWLGGDSRVFLFDEPTKGVDVGGRAEIYAVIDELASQGAGVIVVSSDLPEIIALSDRVLVMRNGRVVAEHVGEGIQEQALIASAMGVSQDSGEEQ